MEKSIIVNRATYKVTPNTPVGNVGKPVICITTGEIFKSATEAGNQYGIRPSYVSQNCNGISRKTNGMVFAYVEDLCYKADEIAHRISELIKILDDIHEHEKIVNSKKDMFKEMVEKQQLEFQKMMMEYVFASNF